MENYARVRLVTDRYAAEGAKTGDIGYLIEVYPDAYEVEFSDTEGITYAQIVVRPDEIESCELRDPLIIRMLQNAGAK